MSHGIYNTQYINTWSEQEERDWYQDCIATLKRHTGKQLKGMFGPHGYSSDRSPDLMAEAGLIYHSDWMHDDEPVPIKVKSGGKMVSVPYSIELNDGVLFRNHYEGDYFVEICKAQFDQLYEEGADSGRVMCIAIHPYLLGQPHRVKFLDEALGYIMSHDGVWQTTPDEIAEHYIANYYDQAVARPRGLTGSYRQSRRIPHVGGYIMPAERRFGMDHEHYDWSPVVNRGVLRCPKTPAWRCASS